MKITHICDYFSTKLWYQETCLAKEEVNNWDNVFVITSNKNYPFPNYEDSYKKILWERKMKPWITNEWWIIIKRKKSIFEIPTSALIIYLWVLGELRNIKPDIIICHDLIKPNNIWAYIYKMFFNKSVKIVIDTHEAEYNTKIDSLLKKIYIFFRKIFFKPFVIKYSDKIVATWPNEGKFARKYFIWNSKMEIIPLWADTNLFSPNCKIRNEMRLKYNIKNSDIVFINAWKINESKKNLELLKAFIKLRKQHSNIRLFFIWDWDHKYIEEMKSLIPSNITDSIIFIPFVKNEELPKYFNMADIWVRPWSRSNVFWEAASCWLPLILENREYTREFITDNWILLDSPNEENIYNAMKWIISKDLVKMWKKSRNIIESKFSWKIINKKFLE